MFSLMHQPEYFILTIHFNNLIKTFNGAEVRRTLTVLKYNTDYIYDDTLERHLANLFETYGKDTIYKFFDLIYGLEVNKKVG